MANEQNSSLVLRCAQESCRVKLKVAATLAGKSVRCPRCKAPCRVPAQQRPESARAVAPELRAPALPIYAPKPAAPAPSGVRSYSAPRGQRAWAGSGLLRALPKNAVLGAGLALCALGVLGWIILREAPPSLQSSGPVTQAQADPQAAALPPEVLAQIAIMTAAQTAPVPANPDTLPLEPAQRTDAPKALSACRAALLAHDGRAVLNALPALARGGEPEHAEALRMLNQLMQRPDSFRISPLGIHKFLMSPDAVPLIARGLARADVELPLRLRLVEALGWNDSPEAETLLLNTLPLEADETLSVAMCRALEGRKSTAVLEALEQMLLPTRPGPLRWAAADALFRFGPRANAALVEATGKDPDPALRQRIALLLRSRTPDKAGLLVVSLEPMNTVNMPPQLSEMFSLDLRTGDVIVACNSRPCRTREQLLGAAREAAQTGPITLKVFREGKEADINTQCNQLVLAASRMEATWVGAGLADDAAAPAPARSPAVAPPPTKADDF